MSLLDALRNATRFDKPFRHWEISGGLSEAMMKEVGETVVPEGRRAYDGTRAADAGGGGVDGALRCYISPENVSAFPAMKTLIDELLDPRTVSHVSDMIERDLGDAYLRVEVIVDREGFWLSPHKDIKEKLMSMQLYVNFSGESENLGTDLYTDALERVKTIPYRHNGGYMFAAAEDTWHGLEKKPVVAERRSVLINYVTFETGWKLSLIHI